ncbi:HAMP domain-containing sensor histidine kinase [Enterococcus sp. LJL98]
MSRLKSKERLKELKSPSLTIKWAFASSFFIFVVFTIFAVITYKSSINLYVAKERREIEETTYQITSRLANENRALNLRTAFRSLQMSETNELVHLDGMEVIIDPFLVDAGNPDFHLFVYNPYKELVLMTTDERLSLAQTTPKEATIETINNQTGFLLVQPVYSKETRELIGYVQTFYELTNFYEIRNRLISILIILEGVSLVLSSILGYLLSAYFLKPLKLLRDTMEKIQKDPQSDIHMPKLETNDELADLAEIFNDMLDRMRSYTELQEQFVEDVSHELRTPVAVIEGHLNMLNRWGKDDPEILAESLEASMQEIKRMKTLVQEMLDLSRAEQVNIHYSNERTNAKEVVHQIVNNFRMIYPEFVFTLDDDLYQEKVLKIYRNHFEQVLIIIMDNAVKYSTDRKEVHISISTNLKELEIAIQDFGEGIPPEDVSRIFHRFYRVDKARARTKGGNGLGLSIASKLIDSYKGRIYAESSLGQGTIFRLFIPIQNEEENY